MDTFTGKMKEICLKKGDDYANDDRLSNFKKVGAMVNQGAQMPILVLMATKVARLSELLTGNKTPNNESIEDSFLDLANYAALGYMLHKEKKEEALAELATLAQDLGLGYNEAPEKMLSDTNKNSASETHVVPMADPLGLQVPVVASPGTKVFSEDELVVEPSTIPMMVRCQSEVMHGRIKKTRTTFTPIPVSRHDIEVGWKERYSSPMLFAAMPLRDRGTILLALNAAIGTAAAAELGEVVSVKLVDIADFDA